MHDVTTRAKNPDSKEGCGSPTREKGDSPASQRVGGINFRLIVQRQGTPDRSTKQLKIQAEEIDWLKKPGLKPGGELLHYAEDPRQSRSIVDLSRTTEGRARCTVSRRKEGDN